MTPIYRSPDENVAKAIQQTLAEHKIESSIIETKNAGSSIGGSYIKWYELWLRKQSEAARAKVVITQYEFTSFRKRAVIAGGRPVAPVAVPQSTPTDPMKIETEIPPAGGTESDYDEAFEMPKETLDLIKELDIKLPAKRREEWIPINNKRVFRRLGLLLGFSEEQIEENDRNKLYRPWDSSSLMEKIALLKQKCR